MARMTEDWVYDEAWALHQLKTKLAPLLTSLMTVQLPQHVEEMTADVAWIVAQDDAGGPNVNPADGTPEPSGPDLDF